MPHNQKTRSKLSATAAKSTRRVSAKRKSTYALPRATKKIVKRPHSGGTFAAKKIVKRRRSGGKGASLTISKDLQALREDVLRLAGQVSTLVSATGDQALGDLKQQRMRQMADAADIGDPEIERTGLGGSQGPIEASAYAPSSRARALLQGVKIAEADLKEAGGAFDLEQVQIVLNNVSRQAVEKRVKDGSLLAVPGPNNRRRYPTIQFTREGVVPGLKDVQEALPTRNPWTVLNFLVRPDDRLGGRKPIEVLRNGDVDLVVSAARGMGEQGG